MHRALRIGAGLGLAFFVLTCTDRNVAGPRRAGQAALDLAAFTAVPTPGQPPIPIDGFRISLATVPDSAVMLDTTFAVRPDTLGDSSIYKIGVELKTDPQDFYLTVRAVGAGITWYVAATTVTISAGNSTTPALLTKYVGPGANAARIAIAPLDTSLLGGLAATYRAIVYDSNNTVLAGVPVGFLVRDTSLAGVAGGTLNTAQLTGRIPKRDSTWVVAQTPTHLKDSTRVHILPPAATLTKVSGDGQGGVINVPLPNPLVVKVLDGLGGPFKGQTVTWAVTAGSATLSAPTTVSDTGGLASITLTPLAIGNVIVTATAGALAGSPQTFTIGVAAGTVHQVILTPKVDTIALPATVQYTAVLKDSAGNTVAGTVGWSSTVTSVATVSGSGLATAVGGDSTRIVASSGGFADTARLFVRALKTIAMSPSDTVVTAVGDSLLLKAAALDNFGDTVKTGTVLRFVSATPTIATANALTGRVNLTGPGNAVVVARDSLSGRQGAATIHVNQIVASIVNAPVDSIQVGANGRGQIVARALDRNGHAIPGKTFGWLTRDPVVASVDQAGVVTGLQVGAATYAVDTLADSAAIFRDSTRVSVVALPPAVIQWAFDSTAIGNGGNISVSLSLTRTSAGPLIVKLASSDTTIVKPQNPAVTIPANTAGTSVVINGLGAGRVSLIASDSSGLGYQSDTMVVTVVSTIEFREIGQFSRQQYFYVNQNETHNAQVFLSDAAPPGGLGVTFVYKQGSAVITPAPAIIPAGQLSASITITGLTPVIDSVVPTSGGFVGKFSYVYVGPDSLRLNTPYPYTGVLGVGQSFQPTVQIPYSMDHVLVTTASLTAGIGTVQSPDTILTNASTKYFTVNATALGSGTLTVSAPGWVASSIPVIVSTPHAGTGGTVSMVAGDPSKGSWPAYAEDSLRWGHPLSAPVVFTATSRDTAIVAVDIPTTTMTAGNSSVNVGNALRAQPGAGGDSTWIVISAPGYTSDSFLVRVTMPTLSFSVNYPYDGHLGVGTIFPNAGYVQIPYARPDTFTVSFGHTRPGVTRAPASLKIPAGQTIAYFNLIGDTLGSDTMSIASAAGYVVSGSPRVYTVDSLHVRPYSYPSQTNYTIAAPAQVSAYAVDAFNSYARNLITPLRVTLTSSKPGEFTLDSAQVTIDSGQYVSHVDTLRWGAVDTIGGRVLTSAPGSTADSSSIIRLFPTPLTLQYGYPYVVSRGLRLPNNYVYVTGGVVPALVKISVQRGNRALDSLTADTVQIPPGQNSSSRFEIQAFDSTGFDTLTASAPGYVTSKVALTPVASRLAQANPGTSHLTTEPPARITTYLEPVNSGVSLKPFAPETVTVVSTDPNVIALDSALTINARGDTATFIVDTTQSYSYYRIRYLGSGSARLKVSAPGFLPDSSPVITVTGPTVHLSFSVQTVGTGQLLQSLYAYVDNIVTGSPLVVNLGKSDSTLPPGSQAFLLSQPTVTIPVNQSSSGYFTITGQVIGSAQLIARATGYSQSVATVSVGQPQLYVTPTLNLYVGAVPATIYVYAEDQNGNGRNVAAATAISDSSTDSTVVAPDSTQLSMATGTSYTSLGIRGKAKGSAEIVFRAANYKSDTMVVSVDTGQLTLNNPPNGLGTGLVAVNQMYVQLPYTTLAALVVSLSSDNTGVLTVPATVTIPAGQSSAYFNVTGVAPGTANVTATAAGARPSPAVPVRISTPMLSVSMSSTSFAGQKQTITVYSRDSVGNYRTPALPLTVTVASSSPTHTAFDSATITIPTTANYAQTGVSFDTSGSFVITASAGGFNSGTAGITVTGAQVTISDFQFTPATVTIPAGQTVTWYNAGPSTHTPTSDANTWSAGTLAAGQRSGAITFSTSGTFTYHCAIHPTMTATVVVQ